MTEVTDWTAYYQRTPGYTQITRSISTEKISGILGQEAKGAPITVCELGGANSCFVEALCDRHRISKYHVADLNEFGLSLLEKRTPKTQLTYELADVTEPYNGDRPFDVVYSVGLIEHFDAQGTRKVIQAHFDRCRPGGLVLITFPTPTWLYRVTRGVAEAVNKWSFPDERPLRFAEVESVTAEFGVIEHRSINWPIFLTQGYIAARAN